MLQRYASLEDQRHGLLALVDSLSNEQLNKQPNGKWSIAQVLSHIIASEQLSINYLNKKILGIKEAANTGLIEELKMTAFIISQRLPIKYKAPKGLKEKTTSLQTVEQVKASWEKTRSELSELLSRFQQDQLRRKVYRHPVIGMINIQQTLRFFQEHIIHHTPQIKNLKTL